MVVVKIVSFFIWAAMIYGSLWHFKGSSDQWFGMSIIWFLGVVALVHMS